MVTIEIDGKTLEVPKGSMVIEAADAAGIVIPRFCYHKKLSVAANCRMCLVEVEKAPKPLPACATPVTDGMKVFTRSPLALDAQKSVMEFLLINHPLDCPICDQGGECDLQDLAMGYGKDVSRFTENKRVVPDPDIGPLIATGMTRCIHCTRCVRFGQEIAGIQELGAVGRGEHTRIGTYVARAVTSELSGNVIDLCPVGALTSKPFRFKARPWELTHYPGIAAHDGIGSNIEFHVRRNEVMRVVPRENEAINETWISDRDRFSYPGLYSDDRAARPLIKQGDDWKEVDWETALGYAAEGLERVREKYGAGRIGALISPSVSVEEGYLLQKLVRGLGSNSIDYRLRQLDFREPDCDPVAPALGLSIAEIENLNAALLIGSWTRKDQPLLGHRLRKASLRGARISALNPLDYEFNFPLAEHLVHDPREMPEQLAAIAKALLVLSGKPAPEGLERLLENVNVHESHRRIATDLFEGEKSAVFIGLQAMSQPNLAELRALANVIAEQAGAELGWLADGANAVGLALAGCRPHRGVGGEPLAESGYDAGRMFAGEARGLILLGIEPEFDSADPGAAAETLGHADFVVVLNGYDTPAMRRYADVILPVGLFHETGGTFVNAEGTWQTYRGAVRPWAEARPAWKVLRVFGNLLKLDGFEQNTVEEVRDELRGKVGETPLDTRSPWRAPAALGEAGEALYRIGHLPIYAIDPVVRRATPLQETTDRIVGAFYLNRATAARLGLSEADTVQASQGGHTVTLPLVIDEGVPAGCVFIPQAVAGSDSLGPAHGPVELQKVTA